MHIHFVPAYQVYTYVYKHVVKITPYIQRLLCFKLRSLKATTNDDYIFSAAATEVLILLFVLSPAYTVVVVVADIAPT